MQATARLLEIESQFGPKVLRIVPIELDGSLLRLIVYMKDGSNLRVTEQWHGDRLKRYSYYWLTPDNDLIIGWDNAPHHRHVAYFPHHKHLATQDNIQPSLETCLDDVMHTILRMVT